MTHSAPSTPSPPAQAAPVVRLHEMRWWHIDAVLELERAVFPEDAWSRGMFWSELAHARGPGATRRYVVAEANGGLLGYAGLAVSGDLADVQTIAVARDQWGTGLGGRLLTDLLRHATAAECAEVMLEVRVDNARAQRLYRRFGFEPIGFRRGYYQPGNVDALVMRLLVQAPEGADGADADGHTDAAAGDGASPGAGAAADAPDAGSVGSLGSADGPGPAAPHGATDSSVAPPPPAERGSIAGDAAPRSVAGGSDTLPSHGRVSSPVTRVTRVQGQQGPDTHA